MHFSEVLDNIDTTGINSHKDEVLIVKSSHRTSPDSKGIGLKEKQIPPLDGKWGKESVATFSLQETW